MPSRLPHFDQFIGYLFFNLAALGVSIAALLESITPYLAFLGVVASLVGSIYTIINQRRKYKAWRSERNQSDTHDNG